MRAYDFKSALTNYCSEQDKSEAAVIAKAISVLPDATKELLTDVPDYIQAAISLNLSGDIELSEKVDFDELARIYNRSVIKGVWDCSNKGNVIELKEDASLDAIYVSNDTKELKIISHCTKKPTLTIRQNSYVQPAIGSCTRDGMSYGRWSPGYLVEFNIILDHVDVVIESKDPNFSLGTYNYEYTPEVICFNDATMQCPEMKGRRYLVHPASAPQGSTKISMLAEYKIGESFSAEQIELLNELRELNAPLADKITHLTTKRMLRLFVDLSKDYPNLDLMPYANVKAVERNTADAMLLGFDDVTCDDLEYQLCIYQLYLSMFEGDVPRSSYSRVANVVFYYIDHVISHDWPKYINFMYTLIPPYDMSFSGKEHIECIKEYLSGADLKLLPKVKHNKVMEFLKRVPSEFVNGENAPHK